jgi:hypothetical protein
MKFNLLLIGIFASVVFAGVEFQTGIVGTTQLNGEGCGCHSPEPDPNVDVWIEGPDTLISGEAGEYKIFLSGGPAVQGGFNVAARFGSLVSGGSDSKLIDGELTHTQPLSFTADTISWSFFYNTVTGNSDTLYSVAQSVNGDEFPNSADKWNFGEKFPITIIPKIPVELISFLAKSSLDGIILKWETATEVNNNGFEVQKSRAEEEIWQTIGFVKGHGTTTEKKSYSFLDDSKNNGEYYFRLKQVDFNGAFEYSNKILINFSAIPSEISLHQNYPNPFNPVTSIRYSLPVESFIKLIIYNSLGEEMATIINGSQPAGLFETSWNASAFTSGIYFYKLIAENIYGEQSVTKKMILTK